MRTVIAVVVLAVMVSCSLVAVAQEVKVTAPAAVAAPAFTEVQALKLQNYQLQFQNIQSQMTLLQQAARQVGTEREALIAEIEHAHPGWTINRETLAFEPVKAAVPKK